MLDFQDGGEGVCILNEKTMPCVAGRRRGWQGQASPALLQWGTTDRTLADPRRCDADACRFEVQAPTDCGR
jgi:hypothetical protein